MPCPPELTLGVQPRKTNAPPYSGVPFPRVQKFVCDEILMEGKAGTIFEELTVRSKEEVEFYIPPAEGHKEVIPRGYYFGIGGKN